MSHDSPCPILQDVGSCGNKQISMQSLHTSVIIIGTILSNITVMLKVCGKLLSLFCITQLICLSLLLYTVIRIMLNVKDIHVILEEHLHASALCGGNVKPTTKTSSYLVNTKKCCLDCRQLIIAKIDHDEANLVGSNNLGNFYRHVNKRIKCRSGV